MKTQPITATPLADCLSVVQAGAATGLSSATIIRRLKEADRLGKPLGFKIGRDWFIPRAGLEKFERRKAGRPRP